MGKFIDQWKQKAGQLKVDLVALYLAYQDPRVSWTARLFAGCVVGYALSPIDLIPDFIPVIGYLDDLVLIPLGIKAALSMIPKIVMAESREKAKSLLAQGLPVNKAAAVIVILVWILLAALVLAFVVHLLKR